MPEPSVGRSFSEPYMLLQCRCGWEGYDDDIKQWDVQRANDRVVRVCPDCDEPVPRVGDDSPR